MRERAHRNSAYGIGRWRDPVIGQLLSRRPASQRSDSVVTSRDHEQNTVVTRSRIKFDRKRRKGIVLAAHAIQGQRQVPDLYTWILLDRLINGSEQVYFVGFSILVKCNYVNNPRGGSRKSSIRVI